MYYYLCNSIDDLDTVVKGRDSSYIYEDTFNGNFPSGADLTCDTTPVHECLNYI